MKLKHLEFVKRNKSYGEEGSR